MNKYILKDYGPSRSVPWQWSLWQRKWPNWAVTKQGWETKITQDIWSSQKKRKRATRKLNGFQ